MARKSKEHSYIQRTIQYLISRWYYILVVVTVWLGLILMNVPCYGALPSMICLAFFARACDDYFDFKKDHGKRLPKHILLKLLVIFSAIFICTELILHGVWGILSVIPLSYILLMNQQNILKLFVLPLILGYFLLLSKANAAQFAVILLASVILNIFISLSKQGEHSV